MENIGFIVPEILLPKKTVDLSKWAVVACDQFSSEPAYWDSVSQFVGEAPSTLKLTYPEAYLESDTGDERIRKINEAMNECLQNGTLQSVGKGIIVVERHFSDPKKPPRKGLILAVDMECYDFSSGSVSLIRATEGTIQERIPPRVRIRENAPLEFPHILILIDDPTDSVMKAAEKARQTVVYDFELMKNSGHLHGSLIQDPDDCGAVCGALNALADKNAFRNRYGSDDVILFAVGDGNHSLATAKSCWEDIKKGLSESERETHRARYALVEIENIYDEALLFEPIHRVFFGLDKSELEKEILKYAKSILYRKEESLDSLIKRINSSKGLHFGLCCSGELFSVEVKGSKNFLSASLMQSVIDSLKERNACQIDYIHGVDVTQKLSEESGNIGIILPDVDKSTFFETVIKEGSFPRKTFSIGHANEKRYYMEARRIK